MVPQVLKISVTLITLVSESVPAAAVGSIEPLLKRFPYREVLLVQCWHWHSSALHAVGYTHLLAY